MKNPIKYIFIRVPKPKGKPRYQPISRIITLKTWSTCPRVRAVWLMIPTLKTPQGPIPNPEYRFVTIPNETRNNPMNKEGNFCKDLIRFFKLTLFSF
jgi:hypothetical protein